MGKQVDRREDGYYHEGKKLSHVLTIDAKDRLVWDRRVNHETGRAELVVHIDYSPHAYPWRSVFTYADGTASDPAWSTERAAADAVA